MGAVFEKLVTDTLRSRIVDKIKQAILNGSLKEGQRLVERQLASQFATSLTAVREALIELEGDGFVVKRPNSSSYVTKLSKDAARKVFDFRRVLEGFAIEQAARHVKPEQILRLEQIYFELLDAARGKDNQRFIQTDFSLHETIWQMADNEYVLESLKRGLLPYFAFTAIRVVSHRPFDLLQDAASHLPLLDAIKAGNPEAARKAFESALDAWQQQAEVIVYGDSEGEG